MNPLVMWIMAHPREDWTAPAVRQRYEALYGPPGATAGAADAAWRSAQALAQRQARAVSSLETTLSHATVGAALRGIIRVSGDVSVPILIRGLDPLGRVFSAIVFATANVADTVADLEAQAAAFLEYATETYDVTAATWSFSHGIQPL